MVDDLDLRMYFRFHEIGITDVISRELIMLPEEQTLLIHQLG